MGRGCGHPEHPSQSQNWGEMHGAGGAPSCSPGPAEGSFLVPSHSCRLRQLAKEPIRANYLVTEPLPPGVFASKNKEFVNLNDFPVGRRAEEDFPLCSGSPDASPSPPGVPRRHPSEPALALTSSRCHQCPSRGAGGLVSERTGGSVPVGLRISSSQGITHTPLNSSSCSLFVFRSGFD